jgi:hypothetical protein
MANSLVVKVTEEGPRNTVVKVVGVVDSGDMNVQRALILSSLSNDDKTAGSPACGSIPRSTR